MESSTGRYGSTTSDIEQARSSSQFASTNPLVFTQFSSRRTKKLAMGFVGTLAAATVIIGLSAGLTINKSPGELCQKPDCHDGLPPLGNADREPQVLGPNGRRRSSEPTKVISAVYPHAAVTSDSQVCSNIGSEVLKRNGSAVDATVATHLCLGLFVPHSMGIGGGFHMTLFDKKTEKVVVIDARERAPGDATEDMYHGNSSLSERGPLAIGVPGELRGLELAYQMYGRLPWAELLAPTIDLCFNGIEILSSLAEALQEERARIFADPGLRQVFVDPNTGDVYKYGDFYTNPQLGKTLQTIAEQGVDALYTGQLAEDLIGELSSMGAILTMEDMANYTALAKEPTVAELSNGIKMYGTPPPGSGAIIANILLTLDGYNFTASDLESDEANTLMHHRIVEAFKFAYAKRTAMGDDQYVDMTGFVQNMTSPDYAAAIRSEIWDNRTYPAQYYEPDFGLVEDHGTSHLSVLAPDGSAVSITSTVNLYFGAAILSQTTGIIMNDEMDDFSSPNITNYFGVRPSASNFIEPGKRPVSSMTPTIITDSNNDVLMVVGGSGGTRITTATAYTIIRNLWLSENVTRAAIERRVHHQLYPQYVEYEPGFSEAVVEGLRGKGHLVLSSNSSAVVNPISRRADGTFEAFADQRKGGAVSGF